MDPSSRTGVPSSSRPSALQTVTSLTSRVLAEPSGCLSARPTNSSLRTGTPVPSIPRYSVGATGSSAAGGSTTHFSSSAISRPSASAARSTCLVGTFTPANSVKSSWPSSKLTIAPTRPTMRKTPGESDPPSRPRAWSRGQKPVSHVAQW